MQEQLLLHGRLSSAHPLQNSIQRRNLEEGQSQVVVGPAGQGEDHRDGQQKQNGQPAVLNRQQLFGQRIHQTHQKQGESQVQ